MKIRLFIDILKGVGRNPIGDGRKKGGLKVHILIHALQSVGKFMKIMEATMHDKNYLKDIRVPRYSMLVFDKSYNYHRQFARWTEDEVYFCYAPEIKCSLYVYENGILAEE